MPEVKVGVQIAPQHATLAQMREAMPDLALRTTFIVGYPGETEEAFRTLLDFIEEIRFDRVGAFQFSFEPGTTSEPLGDPVPFIRHARRRRLGRGRAMARGSPVATAAAVA